LIARWIIEELTACPTGTPASSRRTEYDRRVLPTKSMLSGVAQEGVAGAPAWAEATLADTTKADPTMIEQLSLRMG
jgi:hypothetical protein